VVLHIYPISISTQILRSKQYLIVLVLSIPTCYQPSVPQTTNLISYLIVRHDIAWKPSASAIARNQLRNDAPTHCLPCIDGMYVHFPRYNRRHLTVRTPWSACASITLAGCHVLDMRLDTLTAVSDPLSRNHHHCLHCQSIPQSAGLQDGGNLCPTLIIASCSESGI